MSLKNYMIIFSFLLIVTSCHNSTSNNIGNSDAINKVITDTHQIIDNAKKHNFTPEANKNDSIILLSFTGTSGVLQATIAKDYQQVHIKIKNVMKKYLEAHIAAEGKERNIRFNMIKFPDGKTDGPFGTDLTHATKQKGDYTLIIGKNNMADGMVKGHISVTIKLY